MGLRSQKVILLLLRLLAVHPVLLALLLLLQLLLLLLAKLLQTLGGVGLVLEAFEDERVDGVGVREGLLLLLLLLSGLDDGLERRKVDDRGGLGGRGLMARGRFIDALLLLLLLLLLRTPQNLVVEPRHVRGRGGKEVDVLLLLRALLEGLGGHDVGQGGCCCCLCLVFRCLVQKSKGALCGGVWSVALCLCLCCENGLLLLLSSLLSHFSGWSPNTRGKVEEGP